MSRTTLVRLTASLAAVLAGAALVGYSPAPPPAPSGESAPDSSAAPQESETEAAAAETLTFAQGADLDPTVYIEWSDGLMADDAWEVEAWDDGNGHWSYRTADGACTAAFWQGRLEGDIALEDDRTTSDALIALVMQVDTAEVTPLAVDSSLGYQVRDSLGVDSRLVGGENGDRTWRMMSRAFTAPAVGMYVLVDCAGLPVGPVLDEVIEKNPLIVHG